MEEENWRKHKNSRMILESVWVDNWINLNHPLKLWLKYRPERMKTLFYVEAHAEKMKNKESMH